MVLTEKQLQQIREFEEQGFLRIGRHFDVPLNIVTYTHLCQFEKKWNEITMMCRGLIYLEDGTIVSRPLRKFMNWEEYEGSLPPGKPSVVTKYDGSCLIGYWIGEKMYLATRGSFTSEQAKLGQEILDDLIDKNDGLLDVLKGLRHKTLVFELIHPLNRIVVDYGDEKNIILLAVIDTETGEETDPYELSDWFDVAEEHGEMVDYDTLKGEEKENEEGYVLKWPNGFRLKCKFSNYVRLHRLITGINEKRIWEILSAGDAIEPMMESVPDEFYQYVKGVAEDLRQQYADIEADAGKFVEKAKKKKVRADQAKIIKKCKYPGVGFMMLDENDYGKSIWAAIKPKITE